MINKVFLMGRLTAEPDLRQTTSGVSVCSFRIAVDRSYSGRNGEKRTDFLDIVSWRNTAEFAAKYFSKGKMVIVEGSLQSRNYEDKNGNKRTAIEVVADNCMFGEPKRQEDNVSQFPQEAPKSVDVEPDLDSDDLPF